jgi:hypothetical protein
VAHISRTRAQDHGLVFPGPDGRPRNPANVSSAFRKLVGRTGLPAVTLHALRHGHATLLLDQGERIHDVAARLGHDPAMLLRTYAHHGGDSQDSAAAMETLLDGSRPAAGAAGRRAGRLRGRGIRRRGRAVTPHLKRHRRRQSPERLAIVVWHEGRRLTFTSEGDYIRWAAVHGPHEVQRLRIIAGGVLHG